MQQASLALLVIALFGAVASAQPSWWGDNNPVADPSAVVTVGKARFTVLTSKLIRLEFSDATPPTFNDAATLVVINRRLTVPKFTQEKTDTSLTLQTDDLKLQFDASKLTSSVHDFTPDSLKITFELDGKTLIWQPGDKDEGNLFGTRTSLDCYKPNCFGDGLQPGLLSRNGWVVWDDSTTPLYDTTDWPWLNTARAKGQDYYFFGYGHAYRQCLADYIQIAGKVSRLLFGQACKQVHTIAYTFTPVTYIKSKMCTHSCTHACTAACRQEQKV